MAERSLWPNFPSGFFAAAVTCTPMDDDIRRDIAFALAKHIRSNRPADADEARVIAAANVLRYPRLRS